MPAETLKVALLGGRIQAEVLRAGQGQPLVYLHGAVGQKGWAPFLDWLAEEFDVYAPYLPGYAGSTGLEHLDDIIDLALYHFELMDSLGLASAHLVGHFLGGMVAAEMAALDPSYVDRLVLAAPAGLWRDEAPVVDFLALNSAELQAHLWADSSGNHGLSPEDLAAAEQAQDLLAPDRMQDLTAAGKFLWPIPDRGLKRRAYRIKAPTLVLWGEEDRLIPPVYAHDFARIIPGARTETMPNAGHLAMLEQSRGFAAAVARFLNG